MNTSSLCQRLGASLDLYFPPSSTIKSTIISYFSISDKVTWVIEGNESDPAVSEYLTILNVRICTFAFRVFQAGFFDKINERIIKWHGYTLSDLVSDRADPVQTHRRLPHLLQDQGFQAAIDCETTHALFGFGYVRPHAAITLSLPLEIEAPLVRSLTDGSTSYDQDGTIEIETAKALKRAEIKPHARHMQSAFLDGKDQLLKFLHL